MLNLFTRNIFTRNLSLSQQLIVRKMHLEEVLRKFESYAPLSNAEPWDNVGLLIEPSKKRNVDKIFLCNDLTEKVMNEAVEKQVSLIISYHPPIFQSLKRITQRSWKERIVISCLENSIALYSPHTALDACKNGVNDWLIESLPIQKSTCHPLNPSQLDPLIGSGRIAQLQSPITIRKAIELIKTYTGLPSVHVALAENGTLDSNVSSVGVCAGSGSSVLKSAKANLFITGEMSHHEILDITHNQINLILLNHSNSERGFLLKLKSIMNDILERNVEILISDVDKDPLATH